MTVTSVSYVYGMNLIDFFRELYILCSKYHINGKKSVKNVVKSIVKSGLPHNF